MIHVKNIHHEFGSRKLLLDLNWHITDGSRLALIGPNGCGKTTLMKIMAGELNPTSGQIIRSLDYQIGYLPQEEIDLEDQPILNIVMEGRREVWQIEQQLEEINQSLSGQNRAAELSALISRQEELQDQYRTLGGFQLQAQARKILAGMGFSNDDFARDLVEFSGGWRMRVYLAKLLLQEPDLLLLDEPTNHLDLPSLEWLEDYLKKYKGSVIIVSHDRFFIDRIAREICELENGKLSHYPGTYHEYEKAKTLQAEKTIAEWKNQQKYRTQQQKFIDRFRYKATKAAQVQSRIKNLEKLEKIELPEPKIGISFSIRVEYPSYKDVINFQNVAFRYGENPVLQNITFHITRGERIALVGANGAGKTTLTRLINGDLEAEAGEITLGQKVKRGYFAQHRIEELNLSRTVYEEVLETAADSHRPHIRNILGLFQFSGEEVDKKIAILSGGEKARVSLAKILLSPANFLIMDEPTNHLDIPSRQALEDALTGYDGTLILISHDRYFLDKLVNRVFVLSRQQLTEYQGNYSEYLQSQKAEPEEQTDSEVQPVELSPSRKTKEQKRREAQARQAVSQKRNWLETQIEKIELQIDQLETAKVLIEKELERPDTYKDAQKIISLNRDLRNINQQLQHLLGEWEQYQKEHEELMRALAHQLNSGE